MQKNKWASFWQLFFIQLVQYCIVSISFISLSRENYLMTAITDTVYGFNAFFVIKRIVKSDDKVGLDAIGFVLGGTIGSLLAIWITKHVLHQ